MKLTCVSMWGGALRFHIQRLQIANKYKLHNALQDNAFAGHLQAMLCLLRQLVVDEGVACVLRCTKTLSVCTMAVPQGITFTRHRADAWEVRPCMPLTARAPPPSRLPLTRRGRWQPSEHALVAQE